MGNTQTKEEKDKTSNKEDKKTVEKEEEVDQQEEEERKASVTIIPWSNAERNARISEIKVEKDEMFVSTIFNVKIQEMEQKMDEDSAATSDEKPNENEMQAVRSVLFKHNSRKLEETVRIHSVVDSEDDEQSIDYIRLSLRVQIAKNLVIYTFHQFNGRKWTKTEIEQKVGRSTVDVDVYGPFTTETIFFTMRYMCEEITVPSGGFEYENDFCTHQRITFPEGAVTENTKITIKTLSIEGKCKKNRLKEEMGPGTTISGLSDVVYVHHSQPFKKKVKLRLKLDHLFEDDSSFDTYLFHCDDNGCLKVLDDVKMTRVPEEEVGEDNQIYEVEVDTFSGNGICRGAPTQDHARKLANICDLGTDQCRVLVFLYKENHELHLWSDIVPEKIWKEREKELDQREGMVYLRNTVSPSVPVKNFSRLRITVLMHGRILAAPEVPANSTFMYYDRNAREIFNHVPIVSNKGMRCETGIIQYEVDTAPKRLLHTAYFNAELYLVLPTQAPRTYQHEQTGIQRQTSRTQPGAVPTESPTNNPNMDFFSEQSLLVLAREMPTSKIWELMIQLGLRSNQVDNFRARYKEDDNRFKTALFNYWSNEKERTSPDIKVGILCTALKEVELTPIADVVGVVYNEHRSLTSNDFPIN